MTRNYRWLSAVQLAAALLACGPATDRAAVSTQQADRDERFAALSARVDSLSHEITRERTTRAVDALKTLGEGIAYLTPGSADYSAVRSDLGILTVGLTNVQPYANGSRITLRIGNTTSAKINGAKMTINW